MSDEISNVDSEMDKMPSESKKRKIKTPHKKTPEEFRKMIVEAIESGMCTRKTAATTFNIPYHTIVSIYKQFLDTGEVEPKKRLVFKPKKLNEEHNQFLLDTLAENCNYNIKEMLELLKSKFSIDVSYAIVAKKISAFHFSFTRLNEIKPSIMTPEMVSQNKDYSELFLKLNESGRLLVYLDQAEFQVSMRRFPGRTPVGQEPQLTPPPGVRTREKTILVSMTENELLYYKALDETAKRKNLLEYLNSLFGILSNRGIIGAVLILGNAAFNHCQAVKEVIQAAGHEVIFLPIQSPVFNPVESLFCQWGSIIRSKSPTNEKEVEALIDNFDGLISGVQCQTFCKRVIENSISCVNGKLKYND